MHAVEHSTQYVGTGMNVESMSIQFLYKVTYYKTHYYVAYIAEHYTQYEQVHESYISGNLSHHLSQ